MFRGRKKNHQKTVEEESREKEKNELLIRIAAITKIQAKVRSVLARGRARRIATNHVYIRVFDPNYKRYFWHNPRTQRSVWKKPTLLTTVFSTADISAVNRIQRIIRGYLATRRASREANQVYQRFYDAEKDKFYYVDLRTQRTFYDASPWLQRMKISTSAEDQALFNSKQQIAQLQAQLAAKEAEIEKLREKKLEELEKEVVREKVTKLTQGALKSTATSKHMDDWTIDELSSWLGSIRLTQYIPSIVSNRVDGALFVQLQEPELVELGFVNRLHLKKLEIAMRAFRTRYLHRKERIRQRLANGEDIYEEEDDLLSEYTASELSALAGQEEGAKEDEYTADEGSSESDSEGSWSEEDEEMILTAEQHQQIRLDKANMQIQLVMKGDGVNFPMIGDVVRCKYTCYIDGKVVMSTKNVLDRPWVEFVLGVKHVIVGFDRALQQMSAGERSKVTLSPEYGYGQDGLPPHIGPNAVLTFDITLLGFRPRSLWVKPLIQDSNTKEKPYHTEMAESIQLAKKSGLADVPERIFSTSLILTEDDTLMGIQVDSMKPIRAMIPR